MYSRWEVYIVTEYRNGDIYSTKKLKDIWLTPEEYLASDRHSIAAKHGGDMLVATKDEVFQAYAP